MKEVSCTLFRFDAKTLRKVAVIDSGGESLRIETPVPDPAEGAG